jgi:hypothetical protein
MADEVIPFLNMPVNPILRESLVRVHLPLVATYEDVLDARAPPSDNTISGTEIERLNDLAPASGERHEEPNMATIER